MNAAAAAISHPKVLLPDAKTKVAGVVNHQASAVTTSAAFTSPELQAMELQFQQMLAAQLQQQNGQLPVGQELRAGGSVLHGAAIGIPFVGTDGILFPSNVPASLHHPSSLVPLKLSIQDHEVMGTRPDVSPVVVALAAADSHVRPIGVPLLPTGPSASKSSKADAAGAVEGVSNASMSVEAGSSQPSSAGVPDVPAAPEPEALSWAQTNPWFGADMEMTQIAYQVSCAHVRKLSCIAPQAALVLGLGLHWHCIG
jgi:hypothetical protein